jgi:hypothetical protein
MAAVAIVCHCPYLRKYVSVYVTYPDSVGPETLEPLGPIVSWDEDMFARDTELKEFVVQRCNRGQD